MTFVGEDDLIAAWRKERRVAFAHLDDQAGARVDGVDLLMSARRVARRVRNFLIAIRLAAAHVGNPVAVGRKDGRRNLLPIVFGVARQLPSGKLRRFGNPDISLAQMIEYPCDLIALL